MQKMEKQFEKDDNVKFLYIQTVFEGEKANTFENGVKDIKKFKIKGPFGQDNTKKTKVQFRSRGTPWTIVINPEGKVAFSDFMYPGKNIDEIAKALGENVEKLNEDFSKSKNISAPSDKEKETK